ncbi:DNA alkylation repair protein [Lysinibacter cavernae]|uniref:3-methyladenine DNA glycosylase AlkD n=1 Tax=Lysinibacter cavernae TaxID=1640652 RepID=A0A7X5R3R6_9MICO|nr:DNA alkylation repair protein [Lysinibacter cavernae]NIH55125.1 3-methyladenine DNA glycosylase AlkD [Lysinibacter cavernae]
MATLTKATPLVAQIRARLAEGADPERAAGAKAYLKSRDEHLGVRMPEVRAIVKQAARDHPPASLDQLIEAATTLWREASVREEKHAAIDLTGLRLALGRLELLPLLTEMITGGAWWDLVDAVASRNAALLDAHPTEMTENVRVWIGSDNMWLRRSAIICQLKRKDRTDLALLTEAIDQNAGDPEFFIRKAIGWALREYSRVDPGWVTDFVDARATVLSPLSRREAVRNIASLPA